ncbi:MAG TPA: response regulator [Abditibacteriaceae bacterium]
MPSFLSSSADDARSSEPNALKPDAAPRLHHPASSGTGNERQDSDGSGVRVLVVDDHADMLSMMELMMVRQCYIVDTANSGRKALDVVVELCPHVVISDIGMPDMDGLEMMRAMRDDNRVPPFKSIALTGFGLPRDQAEAREAGYDVCLTKPVDFSKLFECIDDLASTLSVEMMARRDIKLESSPDIEPGKHSFL